MHMTRHFGLSPRERLDAGLALTTQEAAELFGVSTPAAAMSATDTPWAAVARRVRRWRGGKLNNPQETYDAT